MKSPPGRYRHSIAVRISGVFFFLLILVTVGVVLTVRYYVQRDLEGSTRAGLIGAMGRLESELYQLRSELSLFSELSARSGLPPGEFQDTRGAAIRFDLVEKTRDRGIELDSCAWGGKNVPSSGILDRAFAGISTVDYVFDEEGPGRIHLIAASLSGFGEERRVSTSSISLGNEFLRQKRESIEGDIALMAKGEVVASSSNCRECLDCLGTIIGDPAQWSVLEAGKSIYVTFDCGPPQSAIATPIKSFDGKTAAVVILRSREREQKALYHATLGITGGTLGFSVAMGAAFMLLTSRALRPLTELTRVTGGIMEGRYGETVPVEGKGEVADLAQAVNRMSVALKEAMGDLSEWNRTLENRVEEKTEELERIHRRMVEVEKLAAMGQLAAGVAHEMNNPLSGIMGYSEIALELFRNRPPGGISPQETEKMVSYFAHIEALSQRCRIIILDMLKFARQHTEEFKAISLNGVIEETLLFLDKQLVHSHVKVNARFASDLPHFLGNGMQMQQVFTNLILNAIQAMPGGGNLDIRTRRNGDMLEAEFVDHGAGIEPGHLNRIFEPFFTTKPVGKGTGLGLSVSFGIVRHHGGEIRVSSDPGKGSSFLVVLPVPVKG